MAEYPPICEYCGYYIHDCTCKDESFDDDEIENNSSRDDDNFLGVDFKYVPGDPFW